MPTKTKQKTLEKRISIHDLFIYNLARIRRRRNFGRQTLRYTGRHVVHRCDRLHFVGRIPAVHRVQPANTLSQDPEGTIRVPRRILGAGVRRRQGLDPQPPHGEPRRTIQFIQGSGQQVDRRRRQETCWHRSWNTACPVQEVQRKAKVQGGGEHRYGRQQVEFAG